MYFVALHNFNGLLICTCTTAEPTASCRSPGTPSAVSMFLYFVAPSVPVPHLPCTKHSCKAVPRHVPIFHNPWLLCRGVGTPWPPAPLSAYLSSVTTSVILALSLEQHAPCPAPFDSSLCVVCLWQSRFRDSGIPEVTHVGLLFKHEVKK